MGRFLGDLLGTLKSTFKIGRSTFDASGLSAQRTLVLPDYNLTLKTAAGADLQTSTSDTTTGRALANGAYGWGGVAPVLAGNDYDNSADYSGLVRNNSAVAAVNYPPQFGASNVPFAVLNARFTSSYGWQFGVRTSGASPADSTLDAYLRAEVNGIWGNWAELWHSLNFDPATKQEAFAVGSWTNLTLINGWANSISTTRVRRIGPFAELQVSIAGGSGEAFTIPLGFRPSTDFYSSFFGADLSGNFTRCVYSSVNFRVTPGGAQFYGSWFYYVG